MGVFVFDKCCGCIDLKTGCFIIGYLSLIGYLGFALACIFAMTLGGVVAGSKDSTTEAEENGMAVFIGAAILLVVILFLLTFIIVLLVGLHKNKPGHVKAYLIYAVVFVVLSILQFIGSVSAGGMAGKDITTNLFSILLSIYFILVIRSQYLVMKNPSRGPAVYNAA